MLLAGMKPSQHPSPPCALCLNGVQWILSAKCNVVDEAKTNAVKGIEKPLETFSKCFRNLTTIIPCMVWVE